MPSLAQSAIRLPEGATTPKSAQPVRSTPPMPDTNSRNPLMIASLPGIGSGPDAVLRQFNGGRTAPSSRILVP